MNRCTNCLIPDSRPDTAFVGGVCSACLTYAARPEVDWDARRAALEQLLDRHHGECIVPSSGGKDSHHQVLALLGLGAHVTVVTASTCYPTDLGRKNIDNLKRYATTIEVSPNMEVRAKLNRLGLRLVGDISWPEHVAIFTTPFNVARDIGVPLLFYGENPQNQYGGPLGRDQALEMTRRWVSEFGGFLGLRPADMVGKEDITERDMAPYYPAHLATGNPTEAHFLGQYLPWDSHRNAREALSAGMQAKLPTPANWWSWENLDNAMTGIHDHFMYRKYGYGRGCAQISTDVRAGRVSRANAWKWVQERDDIFPVGYAGVNYRAVLDHIGLEVAEFEALAQQFTTHELFETPCAAAPGNRLLLKEGFEDNEMR